MFIAHLPVGYLVSRHLLMLMPIPNNLVIYGWTAGLLGAIAPDFDLFYFYLIDQQQHHHHQYWSHIPIFWVTLIVLSTILFSKCTHAFYLFLFSINGFIHLVLDTVVGDIWWLYPFDNQLVAFFQVEAHLKPWWLNFIFHWSFLLELGLCVWAWRNWRHQHRKSLK